MADKARKWTDKRLKQIEKRITDIYTEAQGEITKSWNAYMEKVAKKLEKLQQEYDAAKASGDKDLIKSIGEKLGKAKASETYQNARYAAMLNDVTRKLAEVNQTAVSYINGELPSIYAVNYNAIATEAGKVGVKFTLVNESTLRRRILDGDITNPFMHLEKFLSIPKDQRWNTKLLNSQILQGIIQGEPVKKIADRIYPIVNHNKAAAIRNARTMVTGAENKGRQDSADELEELGAVIEKTWIATHDSRTRDSHIELDGVSIDNDERFDNGLMYPGDPSGAPEEVYNCFIGETKVCTNTDVIRTYKHNYKGDLYTIKTAGGIQFTCTPNHPIFTMNGWISANGLNKGDDLIVAFVRNKPLTRVYPHINHILSRFDTLHKFFYEFVGERTCSLDVNFHGDIPTSEVEIITQKRLLRDNGDGCGVKRVNKFLFKNTDKPFSSHSSFMEHFRRIRLSSFGFVCRHSNFFAIFSRSLRHSQIHRLRPIALLNSGRVQTIYDNRSCNSELFSECLDRFSGVIFADKIVDVQVNFSHCNVYNLQSENGYYFVNSIISQNKEKVNGIFAISHNCRCTTIRKIVRIKK